MRIGRNRLLQSLFVAPVSAVAVRTKFPDQFGIAAALRVPVGILAKPLRLQCFAVSTGDKLFAVGALGW